MAELIDGYGRWIVFGALILAMLWMHAGHLRGGGHGRHGGHGEGSSDAGDADRKGPDKDT